MHYKMLCASLLPRVHGSRRLIQTNFCFLHPYRYTKFQGVNSITFHFPKRLRGSGRINIHFIGLKGSSHVTRHTVHRDSVLQFCCATCGFSARSRARFSEFCILSFTAVAPFGHVNAQVRRQEIDGKPCALLCTRHYRQRRITRPSRRTGRLRSSCNPFLKNTSAQASHHEENDSSWQ